MKESSKGFGKNKNYEFFTKSGKKLYKAIEYLKKKWNSTPITKGMLKSMLLDARRMGFEKAVVFAKKKQDKYKKDSLLVYKKNPIRVTAPNNIFDVAGKLYSMYIMLPEETPPEDVEIRPTSECTYAEQEVPLKDTKELGRRIVEIIKALESTPLAKPDIIPKAPPSEKYMYFFDKKDPEKFNPATPVHFVPPGPYENTYKSSSWYGTVGGAQIQPVDPHSACYYEILCCGQKPSPDAKVVIKNYMKKRSHKFFNMSSVGVINPISFVSKSQVVSSQISPPDIKQPLYPVPGPGRYPTPKLKIPGYKINIKGNPQNPQRKKPVTTGGRGGVTSLSGRKKGSSMRSFEINRGRFANSEGVRVISGNGLNTRKRAKSTSYKRGAWYNNQGFLGQGSSLESNSGHPEYIEDNSNILGLNGTNDLPFIQIDLPTNRTGLGVARERINKFKEPDNVLKAYGYYFTDVAAPPIDPDFGAAATEQYIDNVFFYPYDIRFGNDTFIDFFVKFKGDAVKLSPTAETDFYFAIIGQSDPTQPAFVDTLGTGKQSIGIGNNVNNVIIEIRMRYENINPSTGIFSARIRCINGAGGVVAAPAVVSSPPIPEIVSGIPLHVRLRMRVNNLGTPAGNVVLENQFILEHKSYTVGNYNAPVGIENVTTLNKLAFGYIDYQAAGLTAPLLSGRVPPLSCGANLTGLQLSKKRIPRNYVWDYTRITNP